MGRIPGTKFIIRNAAISTFPLVGSKETVIIGTAASGPHNEPTLVLDYREGVDYFGEYDGYYPYNTEGGELTLVRGLELHFAQGGGPVWATRVVGASGAMATFTIESNTGNNGLPIAAKYYGGYGSSIFLNAVDDTTVQSTVQDDYLVLTAVASEAARHTIDTLPSKRAKPTSAVNTDGSELQVIDQNTAVGTNFTRVFTELDYLKADPAAGTDIEDSGPILAVDDDVIAWPFKTYNAITIDHIKFNCFVSDGVNNLLNTDIVQISIHTDNAGSPSGTQVGSFTWGGTGSAADIMEDFTAIPVVRSVAERDLDLTANGVTISLGASTIYWLVIDAIDPAHVLTEDLDFTGYDGVTGANAYQYNVLQDLNGGAANLAIGSCTYYAQRSDGGDLAGLAAETALCASYANVPFFEITPVLTASQGAISCGDSDVDQAGEVAKQLWFEVAQTVGDFIKVTYEVEDSKKIEIVYSPSNDPVNDQAHVETYYINDCADLARDIIQNSELVDVYSNTNYAVGELILDYVKLEDISGTGLIATLANAEYRPDDIGTATSYVALGNATYGGTGTVSGNNGIDAGATEYSTALSLAEAYDVWFVTLPGRFEAGVHGVLDSHITQMWVDRKYRIGVMGHQLMDVTDPSSPLSAVTDVTALTATIGNDHLVYTTPGIKVADTSSSSPTSGETVTLSAAYSACVMSGKLSSQDPGRSVTNKTVAGVSDLEKRWRPTELGYLMDARIESLNIKNGIRWLSGLTTSAESLWKNIMTVEEHKVLLDALEASLDNFPGNVYDAGNLIRIKRTVINVLDTLLRSGIIKSYKNVDVYGTSGDELAGIVNISLEVIYMKEIKYVDVYLAVS